MALTDAEKREARATDDRAAAIIDRVDNLPPELLDRLHGTVRYLRGVEGTEARRWARGPPPAGGRGPDREGSRRWGGATRCPQPPGAGAVVGPGADRTVSPETDGVVVAGVTVAKGSRVRLRPGQRADAQDMFLAGREATVGGVP